MSMGGYMDKAAATMRIIKGRRSVRRFKKEPVSKRILENILEAARWAPSGLNNQPWRFLVCEGEKKNALARFTKYAHIITGADKLILVFLDKQASYSREKDIMAVGACVQNMLLYIQARGLGGCWLGEILNNRQALTRHLKLPRGLELEAAIALGKPASLRLRSSRKLLKSLIIDETM